MFDIFCNNSNFHYLADVLIYHNLLLYIAKMTYKKNFFLKTLKYCVSPGPIKAASVKL